MKRKTGFELAIEDVKEGRVTEYASVKELIEAAKNEDVSRSAFVKVSSKCR